MGGKRFFELLESLLSLLSNVDTEDRLCNLVAEFSERHGEWMASEVEKDEKRLRMWEKLECLPFQESLSTSLGFGEGPGKESDSRSGR